MKQKFGIFLFVWVCGLLLTGPLLAQQSNRPIETNLIPLSFSQPRTYTIDTVKVVGARLSDPLILISLSGLQQGDKITIPGEEITRATKKLYNQRLYNDVAIYVTDLIGERVEITIWVDEIGTVSRVFWHGIGKAEEQELMDKVMVKEKITGKIMTNALVKNSELAIKRFFDEKGFLNSSVRTEVEQDPIMTSRVRVHFYVTKGDKVHINKIFVQGNEAFDDRRVKAKLKGTKEKPRFWIPGRIIEGIVKSSPKQKVDFLTSRQEVSTDQMKDWIYDHAKVNIFAGSKFIKNKFDEDKEKLVGFYNSKGYRDARVTVDSVWRSSSVALDILLKIEEGQQYFVGDINWVGNYVHPDEKLNQILGVKRGDIYNTELIDRKLNFDPQEDVSSLYMDDGYLFFSVRRAEVGVRGDTIDIQIRLNEGPQATINRVTVTGNERTNDHVIIRELFTRPAEKFSRSNIIRSQRELSNLGYFNPENINPRPIPNQNDGTVDIAWTVEETPSDQIELSGGWGGPFGFIGTVGLRFNNFSMRNVTRPSTWRPLPVGDGQSLGIRMQANGRRFQSYSLNFMEPWFGGKRRNALSVGVTQSIQRNIDFFTNEQFGSFKVSNITLGLGRQVPWPDNFFQVSNSVSFMIYDVNNFGSLLGLNDGLANNLTFNTVISRNSVNNPFFPSFGSTVTLTINATPPYSLWNNVDYSSLEPSERFRWVEYHKWMLDASYFVPLPAKFTLMAKANIGFIGLYDQRTGFSPFERFIMGGSGLAGQQGFILAQDIISMRGYEDNSILPVDAQTGFRGGVAYNKFTMEMRYPVSTNPSATIFLLTFAEGGNTVNNYRNYNPFNLYRSAGFGARIFMPAFGLLGVDWGYGFDKLPGQNERSGGQIHFVIGQQIR
jgi:outer membrane protein insertion porin family